MQRLVAHNEGTKMTHLCINPVCGPECSQCSRAISEEQTLLYAVRYAWLRANWGRLLTDTQWNGVDVPRTVLSVDIGSAQLGTVSPDSLDAAIDVARGAAPAVGAA